MSAQSPSGTKPKTWEELFPPIDRKFTNVIPPDYVPSPAWWPFDADEIAGLQAKWPRIWGAVVAFEQRADALQAEVEMLREALTEVTELLSFEINPANYDEDDVSRLNGNSIGAWQVATAALKGDAQ